MVLRKRVSIIGRLDSTSSAEFDAHWAGPHIQIVRDLAGLRTYVQHHLVEPAAGGGEPIDGISEVLFEAPEDLASNAHYLSAQLEDELTFVSAVTAMPIVDAVFRSAPWSVWIATDQPADPRESPGEVLVNWRDERQPVMTRDQLRTEPHPPRALVSCGFWSRDEARSGRDRLVAAMRPGDRVALTESLHVL